MATPNPLELLPRPAAGERLYHARMQLTRLVEFGTPFRALLSRTEPPPPCGARFDAHFEGRVEGPRLRGSISGVDYLHVRADGLSELHIHAAVETEDGARISVIADGTALPDPDSGIFHLYENVSLHSTDPRYLWVNVLPILGEGHLDPSTLQIEVDGIQR